MNEINWLGAWRVCCDFFCDSLALLHVTDREVELGACEMQRSCSLNTKAGGAASNEDDMVSKLARSILIFDYI